MTTRVKIYLSAVIAAGAGTLIANLRAWASPNSTQFWIFALIGLMASILKLKMPGMRSTYSFSSFVLLYGVFHFTLPQTLAVASLAAVAQVLSGASRRDPLKVAFNVASHAITVAVCYSAANWLSGLQWYGPAVYAASACVYFCVNTSLVAGAASLAGGQSFQENCNQWYVWTAPYFLVGATVVGLFAASGASVNGWFMLVPLLYLLHFFSALATFRTAGNASGANPSSLPPAATKYVYTVILAGAALAVFCAFRWRMEDPVKLAAFAAVTVAASTLKIRLPGVTGTLSLNFVLLMVAIAELRLEQAILLGAVAGFVQCLWRPRRQPSYAQVAFNTACLMVSTAVAGAAYLLAIDYAPSGSILAFLVPAALILYASNTVIVATVLCLVESKPLRLTWEKCNFWSLPYYFAGSTAATLMIAASRSTGWYSSFLVLPAMAMIYATYRLHVTRATA